MVYNIYILCYPIEVGYGRKTSLKKELNGILICTLLIALVVLPVTGTINNIDNTSDGQQILTEDLVSPANSDDVD